MIPDTPVVIEHLGSLDAPDGEAAPWPKRRKVLELARFPNAYVKIHGLGEFAARTNPIDESFVLQRPLPPFLDWAYDLFGPRRMTWGSDYPLVGAREGYKLALELTMGELRGMINFCIPYNAIERVSSRIAANSWVTYGKTSATPQPATDDNSGVATIWPEISIAARSVSFGMPPSRKHPTVFGRAPAIMAAPKATQRSGSTSSGSRPNSSRRRARTSGMREEPPTIRIS